jgi:hypothetical protein
VYSWPCSNGLSCRPRAAVVFDGVPDGSDSVALPGLVKIEVALSLW